MSSLLEWGRSGSPKRSHNIPSFAVDQSFQRSIASVDPSLQQSVARSIIEDEQSFVPSFERERKEQLLDESMTRLVVRKYGDMADPRCLEAETVPVPEPGPKQILIWVKAAGLNPIDFKIAAGNLWPASRLPLHPGTDVAGIVVRCGAGVILFQAGDEVMGSAGLFEKLDKLKVPNIGGLGEYVALHEDRCALKPHNWSFEKAAALPLVGLTARMVVRAAALQAGHTCVVVGGSGGVGSVAVQVARRTGARIFVVCSGANADYVKHLGATEVIDYTEGDWTKRFRGKGKEPLDAVLDLSPAGGRSTWDKVKRLLPAGGKFISVNTLNPSHHLPTLLHTFFTHKAGNKLLNMASCRPRYTFADCTATPNVREALDELRALVESGELELPTVEVFAFEDVHSAIDLLKTCHVQGKLVVNINN